MERASVETIIQSLNAAGVRYLVAGGLAVVAHGFLRYTADMDLVLDLAPDNLERAIGALGGLGYRPRAPVRFEEFADAGARAAWIRDKELRVFSLFSPDHPATEIDLFVETPLDFEAAYQRRASMEVAPGIGATFVAIDDLIELKRNAGRPHDLQDIAQLERLRSGS